MTKVPIPDHMRDLPRDKHGRPIPWFAAEVNGERDFRVVEPRMIAKAYKENLCWVCGKRNGAYKAFVIGPMCGINRTSAEPPSHRDCAVFSARACPFLSRPNMVRRENNMPEGHTDPGGIMIKRNPGVTLVWITKSFKPFKTPDGGTLFEIGDPTSVLFFRESRPATRIEVVESIDSGIGLLEAEAEDEGNGAVEDLKKYRLRFEGLIPT